MLTIILIGAALREARPEALLSQASAGSELKGHCSPNLSERLLIGAV
jgi:hypothetical protein